MDSHGSVIGVNTAVVAGAQGLCFAVAADLAQYVVGQLVLQGRIRRGYLGIGVQNVSLPARLRADQHLPAATGVWVQSVEPNTPAARAGLKAGDVLVRLNQQPIDSIDTLHKVLSAETIGQPLALWIWREGASRQLTIIPEEMP